MAHNPILEKSTLSRSLFRSKVDIPLGAVGVLYDGGRYTRTLEPGDSLSLGERSKALTLYVVDTRAHTAVWSVALPTKDDENVFAVNVAFEYRVADPQYVIERRVQDTEALLSRILEPTLRRETRTLALNRYREAENRLEAAIRGSDLSELGLELANVDVTINLDASTRERIRQLDDVERAIRVPQLTEHAAHLPSEEPTYGFDVEVALTYRVLQKDRLPTRTLEEAEQWLWRQVQRALRRVGRRFTVDQVHEAEDAMQEAIEIEHFSDHGLEVASALVEISLDEKAAERARRLTEIHTREEFEKAEAGLEDWQAKRQLDHQRDAIQFYQPLIKEGQWALLAMILSQDAASAEKILGYLDTQHREALATRMEIFTKIVEAGGLEGWQMEEQAKVVLQGVMDQAMKPPMALGLSGDSPLKQLGATGAEGKAEKEQDIGAQSKSSAKKVAPTRETPEPVGEQEADEDREEAIAENGQEDMTEDEE